MRHLSALKTHGIKLMSTLPSNSGSVTTCYLPVRVVSLIHSVPPLKQDDSFFHRDHMGMNPPKGNCLGNEPEHISAEGHPSCLIVSMVRVDTVDWQPRYSGTDYTLMAAAIPCRSALPPKAPHPPTHPPTADGSFGLRTRRARPRPTRGRGGTCAGSSWQSLGPWPG